MLNATGFTPAEALAAAEIWSRTDALALVAVDAPTVNPGSIPILRFCRQSVLIVGFAESLADEVMRVADIIGIERIIGSVCVEEQRTRRWRRS